MLKINDNELQNIKIFEQNFTQQKLLEIEILSEKEAIESIISKYGATISFYKSQKKIDKMVKSLEKVLTKYLKTADKQGKIYSLKAITTAMDKSDIVHALQKKEYLINKMSSIKAKKRLQLYVRELKAESKYLKSHMDRFIDMQKNLGRTSKEIYSSLLQMNRDKTSFVQGFKKKVKSLTKKATRVERGQSEIDQMKKVALRDELWEWIAVSIKPCGDCSARAGKLLTYAQWEHYGLPRSGQTICDNNCYCRLMPKHISNNIFPTVKKFKWNSDDLVLTPASLEKKLKQ